MLFRSNLYFLLLVKRFRDVFKNEELRTYVILLLTATVAITLNIQNSFSALPDAIRTSFFQVSTIVSTTGYATADFNLWPSFPKTILLVLMVLGSCAGSTAGGLKISRVIIAFKNMLRSIKKTVRPHSVNVVRVDGEPISDQTLHATASYITIYAAFVVISTLLLSLDGFDLETNFTATLSCINNIGPGLSVVGPTGNFSQFSYFSKLFLSFIMLVGRLEFMPMLILFSPKTWRKNG